LLELLLHSATALVTPGRSSIAVVRLAGIGANAQGPLGVLEQTTTACRCISPTLSSATHDLPSFDLEHFTFPSNIESEQACNQHQSFWTSSIYPSPSILARGQRERGRKQVEPLRRVISPNRSSQRVNCVHSSSARVRTQVSHQVSVPSPATTQLESD
jgi:hypothetical protein